MSFSIPAPSAARPYHLLPQAAATPSVGEDQPEPQSPTATAGLGQLVPSLQAGMIEHQVIQTFEPKTPKETKITRTEFNSFKTFWLGWYSESIPKEWIQEDQLRQLLAALPASQPIWLERLFKNYEALYSLSQNDKLFKDTRDAAAMRDCFVWDCVLVTLLFSQFCVRDYFAQCGSRIPAYKNYYRERLHYYFLNLQRFFNFAILILKEKHEAELQKKVGWIRLDQKTRVALFRDSGGYVPIVIPGSSNKRDVASLLYGEEVLSSRFPFQSRIFLVENDEPITQSGYLVELQKECNTKLGMLTGCRPGHSLITTRGFYGTDTEMPFYASVEYRKTSLGANDPVTQSLIALLEQEVEDFLQAERKLDLFFIPLPNKGMKTAEFAYSLLQELVKQSLDVSNPAEQRLALQWLGDIAQEEGKSIEAVMQVLEEDIKTNYQRKIEEEQRARTASVVAAATAVFQPGKRNKKGHKKPTPSAARAEPSPQDINKRVEGDFKRFKVEGPIKYRAMIDLTKRVLRHYPDVFLNENQRGSHLVLHAAASAPATLVIPHGSQDRALSQHSANTFLKKILRQVHTAFTGEE